MSNRAVVLAGGLGTRLKPYTVVLPKPLVPVGQYPILEVIVRQLARQGFDHITMAVNHQADLIKAFFGNGRKWEIKIDYSLEDRPLGTIAPLTLIEDLPENFLLMNGDILTDLNYQNFFQEHCGRESLYSIASAYREQVSEYGVLELDEDNNLKGFQEKPVLRYQVSMGVYAVNREVLSYIPPNQSFGFDQLMRLLLEKKRKVHVHRHGGHWLDIGRADDYLQAIEDFEKLDIFLK